MTEDLRQRIARKDDIEKQILSLYNILESNGTNMTDELVDVEGFPRNDIDVLTVRKTRVQIIYLQNDLKELMKEIEDGLYKVHEQARKDNSNNENKATPVSDVKPFLRVDLVTNGSPAATAGLQIDDLITHFGSIHIDNFTGLKMIGDLVNDSKGKNLEVKVKRKVHGENYANKLLNLTPNTWSGKGLLGCNVIPITK